MTSPLDDDRLTAFGLLREVYQGLSDKCAASLAAHGLSDNEFEILLRLGRTSSGRMRMSDLAAQTTLTTSGVTRVVDRLERAGLVDRESCDRDRRGTWAAITSAGTTTVSAAVTDHVADIEKSYTGLLTPDQLSELINALRIVRDAVRPDAVAGAQTSGT